MKAYRGRAKQLPFCCARPYLARFQTSLPNPVRSTAHCLGACATTDVSASGSIAQSKEYTSASRDRVRLARAYVHTQILITCGIGVGVQGGGQTSKP